MEVEDLSPVAQDYLKVIWSAEEWGEAPITTTGLAERFSTTRANVSATLRRLADQGLVDYEPYRRAALTGLGRRLAIAMVRRHRLIEAFLAQTLHYQPEEVHGEAEHLEHAVSERFLERIDALLGHPVTDPHGDPIPDADGRWARQPASAMVAAVSAGRYRVARIADADPALLARLIAAGIRPGADVRVEADGRRIVGEHHVVDLEAFERAAVRVFRVPIEDSSL